MKRQGWCILGSFWRNIIHATHPHQHTNKYPDRTYERTHGNPDGYISDTGIPGGGRKATPGNGRQGVAAAAAEPQSVRRPPRPPGSASRSYGRLPAGSCQATASAPRWLPRTRCCVGIYQADRTASSPSLGNKKGHDRQLDSSFFCVYLIIIHCWNSRKLRQSWVTQSQGFSQSK